MTESRPRQDASRFVALVLTASLLGAILAGVVYLILSGKKQAEQLAEVNTKNLSVAIASRVASDFDRIDGLLVALAKQSADNPPSARWQLQASSRSPRLADLLALYDAVSAINLFDAQGDLRESSADTPPFNVADREHFQFLRDRGADLTFSETQISRSTGRLSIAYSRAIRSGEGRFLGMLSAVIHLDNLGNTLSAIDVGPGGLSLVRRSDNFKLIYREPRLNEKDFNQPLPAGNDIRRRIEAGERSGSLRYVASTDGVTRIGSFTLLEKFPFYVQVAYSADHYLAAWRRESLIIAGLALLLLLASAVAFARLARVQNRLELAMDAAAEGIWDWNLETGQVYFSPGYASMLGYQPDELRQDVSTWMNLLHPDDTASIVENARQRLIDPGHYELEFRMRRRGGDYCWVLSRGRVVSRDFRGHPRRAVGTHVDITYIKQAEALLLESEMRNRLLFEQSNDGIVIAELRGKHFFAANPAFCRLLGYRDEEITQIGVEDIHPEAELPKQFEQFEKFARGEAVLVADVPVKRKDGSVFYVDIQASPIQLGGKDYVMGNFRDITERKAFEKRMIEAKEAADAASRAKSDFLANMSHEIRTPLNGVLGLAQIGYRDTAGNEPLRTVFTRILDSGRLLLTIINDILDFSKIESGKLQIESVALDPRGLVDDAISPLLQAAQTKGLRLVTEKATDLPAACLGDPVRISQILLNLLSNAVKFTARGEVRLQAVREADQLVFRVFDSGIGIAPADIERLFQPFEQADSSTTRQFGGTGLGLAISRRLTELMGGQLTVRSQPGQGSCFELRLPLQETAQVFRAPAMPGGEAGNRLAGLRILVAEDSEINQIVLEEMLQGEGATVTLAGNGRLAAAAVENHPAAFDLVLSDIQMPEMDGIELAKALRQRAPGLPVIGQTAHTQQEEHLRCREAGMVATITKPIDIEDLVRTVLQVTGRTAVRAGQ